MKHRPNRTHQPLTLRVFDKFYPQVDRSGECWLWTGRLNKDGYGMFYIDGGDFFAHRVAYGFANDVSPGALCVCHKCDVRRCVNPAHLFLGTQRENTNDRNAKGRQARGERAGLSKLTEADVRSIRSAYEQGSTQKSLGVLYGVTQSAIAAITNRLTWRHVA